MKEEMLQADNNPRPSVMPTKRTRNSMNKQTNKKNPNWHTSEAKKLLENDLTSGKIPLHNGTDGMEPKDVYLQRPEFAEFTYEYFRDRL
jgi:hypothetical protein